MVADVDSPSYFVATAAVKLGFFKQQGIDVEFVQLVAHCLNSCAPGREGLRKSGAQAGGRFAFLIRQRCRINISCHAAGK